MKLKNMRRRAYAKRGMQWGKRHGDYFAGCIVCEAWKFYDQHGRFPAFDEANTISERENRYGATAWKSLEAALGRSPTWDELGRETAMVRYLAASQELDRAMGVQL